VQSSLEARFKVVKKSPKKGGKMEKVERKTRLERDEITSQHIVHSLGDYEGKCGDHKGEKEKRSGTTGTLEKTVLLKQ